MHWTGCRGQHISTMQATSARRTERLAEHQDGGEGGGGDGGGVGVNVGGDGGGQGVVEGQESGNVVAEASRLAVSHGQLRVVVACKHQPREHFCSASTWAARELAYQP